MKRALVVVLLIIVMPGCQTNGTPRSARDSAPSRDADARASVADTAQRYTQALLKKDFAALDRFWADDLLFINPRGLVQNKQQRMDDLRSGATTFKSIELTEVSVLLHDDAAMHISHGRIAGRYGGQESSGEYRIGVAMLRHGSEWRIHGIQMTPIQKP